MNSLADPDYILISSWQQIVNPEELKKKAII